MFTTFSVPNFQPTTAQGSRGRACDACRRLKIKCQSTEQANRGPGTPGPCKNCREARARCTYLNGAAKRGRPRKRCASNAPRGDETPPQFVPSPFSVVTPEVERDSQPVEEPSAAALSPDEFDFSSYEDSYTNSDSGIHGPGVTEPTAQPEEHVVQSAPQAPHVQAPEDAWETVNDYYDALYIVFPIVCYSELASRLLAEPDWFSQPDLRTLVLSLRLLVAAGRYRMDSRDSTALRDLILQVETSRLGYDYADPAVLDEVVSSLCLFTAYNVLNLHNRAFLYLDEATSLFGATQYEEGNPRALRIEKVLFNTEAASQLYASRPRMRRARTPTMGIESCVPAIEGFAPDIETDAIAARLLERLTRTYVARDTGALVETEAETLDLKDHTRHRFLRIQAADVVVTQQWQLSSKLITDQNGMTIMDRRPVVFSLGMQVMSWICLLREGELRVVGLGKLAELARNIFVLTNGSRCQDILRGLAGAVLREDHEKRYTPKLLSMMANAALPSIPAMLSVDRDLGLAQNPAMPLSHVSTMDVTALGYGIEQSIVIGNVPGEDPFRVVEDLGDLELVGADWLAGLADCQ